MRQSGLLFLVVLLSVTPAFAGGASSADGLGEPEPLDSATVATPAAPAPPPAPSVAVPAPTPLPSAPQPFRIRIAGSSSAEESLSPHHSAIGLRYRPSSP